MISKQESKRARASRREDPNSVVCQHRLTFAWSGDSSLDLEAKHLAMVCTCETLSDWAGPAGRQLGVAAGRTAYVHLREELNTAWLSLSAQVSRCEHVGAPAIAAIFELVEVFLEWRYTRYAAVLPAGRLREEVLANVARQHEELHAYFAAFNHALTDRCRRQDYAKQARYAGDRYLALLGPAMAALLDGDDGTGPSSFRPSSGGGPAAAGSATARRSLIKSVSFESPPPAAQPATPAPAHPTATPPAPSPSAASWPPFAAGPPAYYPGGNPYAFVAASGPFSPPSHGPASWGGFVGSPPGSALSPGAPALGPQAPPAAPSIKPEAGGGKAEDKPFLSQPMHPYVSEIDCASVPAGQSRRPTCGCANHKLNYTPGPHATWDCPLRYINQCGSCPGFNLDGSRDPAQWNGDIVPRQPHARSQIGLDGPDRQAPVAFADLQGGQAPSVPPVTGGGAGGRGGRDLPRRAPSHSLAAHAGAGRLRRRFSLCGAAGLGRQLAAAGRTARGKVQRDQLPPPPSSRRLFARSLLARRDDSGSPGPARPGPAPAPPR